jgi:hypothetical protein
MKKIKKSEIDESKFVVDKDSFDDIEDKLEDDDIVKIVDENDTPIEESIKAIITKNDLIKVIKESIDEKKKNN